MYQINNKLHYIIKITLETKMEKMQQVHFLSKLKEVKNYNNVFSLSIIIVNIHKSDINKRKKKVQLQEEKTTQRFFEKKKKNNKLQ